MASTRTTMSGLLREFYLPGIRETLNQEIFLLSQVEQNSDMVEGNQVNVHVRLGRNHGIGARAESGTLPTAGNTGVYKATNWLAYNYGRIQVSGPLMRSVTSDRGGAARPLEVETRGIVNDLKKDVNRQLYGDGTGILAYASGAETSQTVPVDALGPTKRRQIIPGMVCDIINYTNGAVKVAGLTVESVTDTTVVFVAGVAPDSVDGDYLVRSGSYNVEIDGLAAMVAASGSYLGLDPATAAYVAWASYVDGSAGAPDEDLFVAASQEANLRTGDEINLWITTAGVHRAIAAQQMSVKRNVNTVDFNAGYKGIDISAAGQGRRGSMTMGLVYDADCPVSTAYGLCTKRISYQRASDWEFMDEDGEVLNRVANTDAYEATLFQYSQLVTDSRASHAAITGLTDDA